MSESHYTVSEGRVPLLVSIPHAGTGLPTDVAARMTTAGLAVADTDWFADRIAEDAQTLGATMMVAHHSRYVADLNRDPSGAALYAHADNTGLVPTTTFAAAPIYRDGEEPDAAEFAARVDGYWRPYHDRLYAELARMTVVHGIAVLLDVHSIPSRVPRFFEGRLPDLNLGSADGASADRALTDRAWSICAAAKGFSAVRDGRFKGGYITRRYGQPDDNVHALQIEVAQASYMVEDPPWHWDAARAAPLRDVIAALITAMADWAQTKAAE